MTVEAIEGRLREHRENKARLRIILQRIEEIRGEPYDQYIEGEVLRPLATDSMKVQSSSGISSTERIATDGQPEVAHELKALRKDAWELACLAERMDAAISGLSERERFVIQYFYLENLTWYIVRGRYEKEYAMPISDRALREMRRNALVKLARFLPENCQETSAFS